MNKLVENYINGYIRDARYMARQYTHANIRIALIDYAGYSFKKATLTAEFLKTGEGYQAACDAE